VIEDDAELEELKSKIHRERGFNTHFYKDKCLRRRFAVRMRSRGAMSFGEYSALLDRDPEEYERLLDALTINVTKFFRNRETWEAIERDVAPRLFASPHPTVDVWSAGCASGEEPYSLSILLQEWVAAHGRAAEYDRVRILGTDIDRGSLAAAERAEYPSLSLEETSPELVSRWFSPAPPHRLNLRARRGVRFARSDLISSPPPTGQSLILCRNVIIYFDRSIQETLFRTFYDSLLPGGILVLGRVESLLGSARALFRPINTRERIYLKP
jgi:chemotaxis protein methyltransferase CheR